MARNNQRITRRAKPKKRGSGDPPISRLLEDNGHTAEEDVDQSYTVSEYGFTSIKASITLGPLRLKPQSMASLNPPASLAARQGTPK